MTAVKAACGERQRRTHDDDPDHAAKHHSLPLCLVPHAAQDHRPRRPAIARAPRAHGVYDGCIARNAVASHAARPIRRLLRATPDNRRAGNLHSRADCKLYYITLDGPRFRSDLTLVHAACESERLGWRHAT